jgi:hypothetical protein
MNKEERARCHHANQNWIGRESMNWHFYRPYSLLIVASAKGKERMAGNGRLKCLERKFASITRRECDYVDLC